VKFATTPQPQGHFGRSGASDSEFLLGRSGYHNPVLNSRSPRSSQLTVPVAFWLCGLNSNQFPIRFNRTNKRENLLASSLGNGDSMAVATR
jgi:hypothetical protein